MRSRVLKIVTVWAIFVTMLFSSHALGAENVYNSQELIDKNILRGISVNENFTRKEYLVAVMRVAGMTDERAEMYEKVMFFAPIFGDVIYVDKEDGYIIQAGLNRIAKGDGIDFDPDRYITWKEALIFTLRIVDPYDNEDENIFELAKKKGLIENIDQTYDDKLSFEDGKDLISKMLDCKRYKYFDNKPIEDDWYAVIMAVVDEDSRISYLENLLLNAE